MASIKILKSHKNLIFAAAVSNSTGAQFEEQGEWIEISDSPELTIAHYDFTQVFGIRVSDNAWRSLLLNRTGYLKFFDDHEIILCDDPPKQGQGNFLLRFPTVAEKKSAEEWAERAGYESLTDYILASIDAFNRNWSEQVEKK